MFLPTVVEVGNSFLSVLLTFELDENVAHQVVAQVVTHIHLLHLQ
jgi:hypothetical protein